MTWLEYSLDMAIAVVLINAAHAHKDDSTLIESDSPTDM